MKRPIAISVACLGLAACLPTIDIPEKVGCVDGAVFFSVCRAGVNWSMANSMKCALMVSNDRGKTWRTHRIDGLRNFVFNDRNRGVLLVEGDLRSTQDGGATHTLLKDFESEVMQLRATDDGLLVLTQEAVYLSRDSSRSKWERIDLPEMGDGVRPVLAAAGPQSLAVGGSVGRVYIQSDGRWNEWIVGGLHDLTYWNGWFYAATQMKTLAVLDGKSMRHVALQPAQTPLGFLSADGTLYLWDGATLHKVVGDKVTPTDRFDLRKDDRLWHARIAMLNDRELVALSGSEHGPEIRILSLDSSRVEKLELPAFDF